MQIESFAVIFKWQTSGHTSKTVVEPGGPGDSHRLREQRARRVPSALLAPPSSAGCLWGGLSSVMTPRPILAVGGSCGAGTGGISAPALPRPPLTLALHASRWVGFWAGPLRPLRLCIGATRVPERRFPTPWVGLWSPGLTPYPVAVTVAESWVAPYLHTLQSLLGPVSRAVWPASGWSPGAASAMAALPSRGAQAGWPSCSRLARVGPAALAFLQLLSQGVLEDGSSAVF